MWCILDLSLISTVCMYMCVHTHTCLRSYSYSVTQLNITEVTESTAESREIAGQSFYSNGESR